MTNKRSMYAVVITRAGKAIESMTEWFENKIDAEATARRVNSGARQLRAEVRLMPTDICVLN